MSLSTQIIHPDQVKNLAPSSMRLEQENVIFDTFKAILGMWNHENDFLWECIGQ